MVLRFRFVFYSCLCSMLHARVPDMNPKSVGLFPIIDLTRNNRSLAQSKCLVRRSMLRSINSSWWCGFSLFNLPEGDSNGDGVLTVAEAGDFDVVACGCGDEIIENSPATPSPAAAPVGTSTLSPSSLIDGAPSPAPVADGVQPSPAPGVVDGVSAAPTTPGIDICRYCDIIYS